MSEPPAALYTAGGSQSKTDTNREPSCAVLREELMGRGILLLLLGVPFQ